MKGILICAADLFKRHLRQNLLLIFMITATLTVFSGFLGKLQYIMRSSGIADTFHDCEAYYYFPYSFTSTSNHAEKILAESGIKQIRCSNYAQVLVRTGRSYATALGYDDTLIDYVNIKLSDGIWFSEYTGSEIPLVGLDTLYHTGQQLELTDNAGMGHQAVVIGTVSPDTYILTFERSSNPEIASLNFFVSVPHMNFIAPYDSSRFPHLDDSFDLSREITGNAVRTGQILLPDTASDYETLRKIFRDYGSLSNLRDMLTNYRAEIRFDLLINGIVLGMFALMTAAGIGGINGIQSRLNRRNYIIYYMLTPLSEVLQSPDLYINAGTFAGAFLFIIAVCCSVSMKYVLDLGKGSLITHYKNQE